MCSACTRPRVTPLVVAPGYEETGLASWYGYPHHGRRTASGEIYDMTQMTAAHRRLPFGTLLTVENLDNGRTVEVRVNDRGPFIEPRILDLSYAAARVLGATGLVRVRLRVIASAPPARVASRDRAFAVQLGAFVAEDSATALQRDLRRAGAEATLDTADVGGRTIYRVRIGRFAGRKQAEARARQLSKLGYPALVVEE
jgi:peptidoglycan lytic transglycosylase